MAFSFVDFNKNFDYIFNDTFTNYDPFNLNTAPKTPDFFSNYHKPNPFVASNKNFTVSQNDAVVKLKRDQQLMSKFNHQIISGYLSLHTSEGWKEGGIDIIGRAFTRYILSKYVVEGEHCLGDNKPLLEKVVKAFPGLDNTGRFDCQIPDTHRPKTSRICIDSGIGGWDTHAVSRMVGNLGSTYDSKKPFFEILINSARPGAGETLCEPFFISVYDNEKELDERRKLLACLDKTPAEFATRAFYPSYAIKPESYLEKHQERLGPHSTHLLKGLMFLQKTKLTAQKSGNCWIKQPLRCLLTALYIEIITQDQQLSFEEAWEKAKVTYKRIQRTAAIPYVESLMASTEMTPVMKSAALKSLAHQKEL